MGEDNHWRYIFTFKTSQCPLQACRNTICWDYHSPQDRRRVPIYNQAKREFNYLPKNCTCGEENCKNAHNYYEMAYHPLKFKTKECIAGEIAGKCVKNGIHCPFAHSREQIRRPATIYEEVTTLQTPPPPLISPPVPTTTDLFQLSREQGALEARLQQLQAAISSRKQAQSCRKCERGLRTVVHSSACGHAVCEECSRPQAFACVVCGNAGGWITLLQG